MANGHAEKTSGEQKIHQVLGQENGNGAKTELSFTEWRSIGSLIESHLGDVWKRFREVVSWKIYVWSLGIITLVMGWLMLANTNLTKKVDMLVSDTNEIKISVVKLETTLGSVEKAIDNFQSNRTPAILGERTE